MAIKQEFFFQGITAKYPAYRDPRCLSIPAAVQSAVSADILGIVVHTEDLLRDPTQVKIFIHILTVQDCYSDIFSSFSDFVVYLPKTAVS